VLGEVDYSGVTVETPIAEEPLMNRLGSMVTAGLFSLAACFPIAPAQAAPESLNARVLDFAKGKLDQKVGNGECWTLAFEALKSAQARLPGQGGYGIYVFGRAVALAKIIPGDVLQFEKARFKESSPDGGKYTYDFPQHTAIVHEVKGRKITLIHQNVNNVKRVVLTTINLDSRQGGSVKAYRPQPR
jgi:hypothetical protein